MNAYIVLLLLTSNFASNTSSSLDLVNVTYTITKFQDSVHLDFNLIGVGQANARIRVCDSSFGCREDMPSTILQSQNISFNQSGINRVLILKFNRNNESKRINILYTNNLGASSNLNFTITSAFPRAYNIYSTTFSKIIRETSYVRVSSSNAVTTVSNSLDFRSFYSKPNQNIIINSKDFLVSNGGVYINMSGFIELFTGLENSEIPKFNSYYELDFISKENNGKIQLILDKYYLNKTTREMTKIESANSIKTENIVLSSNYDKTSFNELTFNFSNVGSHGSNIRVTTSFSVNRDIFGNCNSAIVCINKRPIRDVNYTKKLLIR
jgi:hypothetical protein